MAQIAVTFKHEDEGEVVEGDREVRREPVGPVFISEVHGGIREDADSDTREAEVQTVPHGERFPGTAELPWTTLSHARRIAAVIGVELGEE